MLFAETSALLLLLATPACDWIRFISGNDPWRAHSVWNVFYEDYCLDTGDPRTPWGSDPDVPTAEFESVPSRAPVRVDP